MDITKVFDGLITGALALVLIGTAAYESATTGSVEPSMLVMATAVVSVYFTGRANRQVNGDKVAALAESVAAVHTRLDAVGLPPARDPSIPANPNQ